MNNQNKQKSSLTSNSLEHDHKTYEIRPGDTLEKIVNKINTSIEAITKINDTNSMALMQSQHLLIPIVTNSGTQLYEYLTSENESIESISNKFNVTSSQIYYFNKINHLVFKIGQKIVIPKNDCHKILENDTLESILEQYNLTEKELISLNPEWLKPGTTINIISK